ncbi:golgin subfamily A member 6-like protein 22 [Mytilus edulis]|uniref:golgin subfamily A member 6-like protein 22 n=1 Tax=Mytilus edulis TaxID=6550 RepID=UPI0039F0E0E6
MSDNLKSCNICGTNNSSLHICDKCRLSCCQQCLGQHKSNNVCGLIKEHLSPTNVICMRHESCYTKFCLKCCLLVCPECAILHSDHKMDLFSIIDAVKKIRRDIPKCVDSLSEKITNAHKFVTAFPSKMNEFLSLQRQIDVEENVWRTKIIEIAKGLCRQIEQQMTKLDSDCIIQQQYERNAQKTIVILNAVEKVKYSNTFALLWVRVKEKLDQFESNSAKKNILQRVSFQSGVEDHSKLCNLFGSLQYVNIGEDLDDGTLELFKKMKIDDQDEDHREYEKNTEEKRTLEADVQRLECQLHETTRQSETIVEEKETEIQRLKNQIQQSEIIVDEKETEIQRLKNQIETMLEDKIHSKEDTIKMHCEKIKELQQKSNHFESDKNRISEEFEKVCKERDDLSNRRVLKDEILSSKEIIKTQENLQEVNILELQQHVQQLEADKSTLSEKYERICTEMENSKDGMVHKEEIRSKEEIIKTNHETIKELHQQTQQLKTANNGILEKYNQVCKERDELKNGSMFVDELHLKEEKIKAQEKTIGEKIRDLQQESQQLQTERDELVKKYEKVCKERDENIDGNQSIQLAFESMERELKEKETEMHAKDQQSRQQLNEKDRDISDLNQMLNQHKEMVSDQEKKIKTIKKERDDLQLRSQSIQKVFDDYEQRIETYQRIQAEKEIEFQSKQQGFQHHLKQKDNSMSEINRIVNQQKSMISNLEETIKGVRKEKDDLQTRLSSVAGEKLTKGNPSITDLGDPNRPMKIGEKYGELYDNEWTDAMENTIEAKKYYPDLKESELEEIIIRHLHRLLKCCYIECILKAEEQIHKLGEALAETMCLTLKTKDEIASLSVIREALVLRRSKSEDFAKFLFENQVICNNTIADWDYVNKNENLMQILTQSTFFEKCIYLCWCMVIQDPVMHLDNDPVSNTPIDKNTYKEFVKSGDSVAYVVWPALFLHKGGPLLYKGVVQAYWKKDDDDNLKGTSV